ncbi:MAG: thiamine pyrophosphate-binding protein [Victivallaceae bacterium]|nr:thiamine pyrophosphate-binding protein [Victivallaceae bacterium]
MNAAEYIFKKLADWGAGTVFMVSGGGALFLNAALGGEKRLRRVCCLHEQACAMAAEGHARITNRAAVVSVTSGPGGTNALTGVLGAWLDSIPMVVISGQVRTETLAANLQPPPRQLGDQEFNIVAAAASMTKMAECVTEASAVPDALRRAWILAHSGRPGPVWLDVPLDVQSAPVDDETDPVAEPEWNAAAPSPNQIAEFETLLATAERPAIVAGNGVRLAGARNKLRDFVERLNIPILTAPSGIDLMPSGHPLFFGHPGVMGNRAANLIMQNSDCLIALGARMSLRVIGFNWDSLAPAARRVMVDLDPAELNKSSFRVDLPVEADAGKFMEAVTLELPPRTEWLDYCRRVSRQYEFEEEGFSPASDHVSSYVFPKLLNRVLPPDAVVVCGNGTAYTSTFQAMEVPDGRRMFANVGCASMGYDIPAALGAQLAAPDRVVALVTGDGSIQMNIQELETVRAQALPIKMFVYNNDGYLSIKLSQRAYCGGRLVGADPASGVHLPPLRNLAAAYGIPYFRLENHGQCEKYLPEIMAEPGPVLTEIICDPMETLGPKAASARTADGRFVSRPLDDMAPPVSDDEFYRNDLTGRKRDEF